MMKASATLMAALAVAGIGSGAALASPAKPASLEAAAQRGAHIFATDSFGGKRMFKGQPATCASCHSNGGRTEGTMPNGAHIPSLIGVAAQFPKFIPQKHKVITLEEQL
ncbi:MAG TPA: hypothetical protein VFN77_07925, partial [Acetobacteraceae bacterium]|nr:hypothetical protein [Acetobacteraceae bacterium]